MKAERLSSCNFRRSADSGVEDGVEVGDEVIEQRVRRDLRRTFLERMGGHRTRRGSWERRARTGTEVRKAGIVLNRCGLIILGCSRGKWCAAQCIRR